MHAVRTAVLIEGGLLNTFRTVFTVLKNEGWAGFRTYVHNQVRELLTYYGQIDVIWFDGARAPKTREGTTIGATTVARAADLANSRRL